MCRGHCCGFGTKKSVVFSAFFSVFTAVVCMSMMLLRFTTKVDVEIHADVSALSYGSLAIYSIHIVVSFVLLAGANLDRRGTFFPWVAWTFAVMMYEALAVLLYFSASKHKQKGFRRWDVFSSFFYVIRTSVNIYCLICVVCRYRIIRASEEAPCTYIFPSPENCGRRPRLQKDLITIMESAFRSSTENLAPNTVILLTSLPPPYENAPPPYGEPERLRLTQGGATRVVVECDVTKKCACRQLTDDVDSDVELTVEDVTFLREKRSCECGRRAGNPPGQESDNDVMGETRRLRHGTILWDDVSDNEEVETGDAEGAHSATVYRNPMVLETTSCSPVEDV